MFDAISIGQGVPNYGEAGRQGEIMNGSSLNMEVAMQEFRRVLPAKCATAQAIDGHQPWEKVASEAVTDGYVDVVEKFKELVEAVLGHAV